MDERSQVEPVLPQASPGRREYADLVRSHSARVFAICLGMLGNVHDAEDAAQQTFLKGFAQFGRLDDANRFGAWIAKIAKNLCLDVLRAKKRAGNMPASRDVTGASAYDAQMQSALLRALMQLDEDYRLVLMLYYFDGQSSKTVAGTLQISIDAVHARLSRGRKMLRKLIESSGAE